MERKEWKRGGMGHIIVSPARKVIFLGLLACRQGKAKVVKSCCRGGMFEEGERKEDGRSSIKRRTSLRGLESGERTTFL